MAISAADDGVVLKINKFIKTPNSKIAKNFKILKIPNFSNINSTKYAESNFSVQDHQYAEVVS